MNAKITNIASRKEAPELAGKKIFTDNLDHLQALEFETVVRLHLAARRTGRFAPVEPERPASETMEDIYERVKTMNSEDLSVLSSRLECSIGEKTKKSLKSGMELNFERLSQTYDLDEFERGIVLLLFFAGTSARTRLLMVDLKLSKNESKTDMTVGLIIEVLSSGFVDQLRNRKYFGRSANLIMHSLALTNEGFDSERDQLIEQGVILHPRIINFILGDDTLYDTDLVGMELIEAKVDPNLVVVPGNVLEDVLQAARSFKSRIGSEFGQSMVDRIGYGSGLAMLFHGPSGTGKTMLAHAVAATLDAPLVSLKLNLTRYGITTSIIRNLFREARLNGGIVFIDECDDVFEEGDYSSRTLLIELERSQCLTILTTNQKTRLDPALDRRIALKVGFDLPDRGQRRLIWSKLIPPDCRLHQDVDLEEIAERFVFSGGLIKNALLMALDKALVPNVEDKPLITRQLLLDACEQQARSLSERFGFGKVVKPSGTIDALQLRTADATRLKNLSSCLVQAATTGDRLVIMVTCRSLETGLSSIRAALASGGLASRDFSVTEAIAFPAGRNIEASSGKEVLDPLQFIFTRHPGIQAAVVLVDEMDELSPPEGCGQEISKPVMELLNAAQDSHDPVIVLTRNRGRWDGHPLFDYCLKISPPAEESQFALWRHELTGLNETDSLLLDTVGRHSLHGHEIVETARKARLAAFIESGSEARTLFFLEKQLARGKRGTPLLFGDGGK